MTYTVDMTDYTLTNLMQTLGITFTLIEKGYLEATMPVTAHVCQPHGFLHGGATLALAESVAGQGSTYFCQQKQVAVGMQVSANHLHPVKAGESVIAKGTLIHQGKSTHLWSIDVFSITTQQLIASIRITNAIVTYHAK